MNGSHTKISVLAVTIPHWLTPRFPAPSIVAAGQGPVGVQKLMVRIRFPVRWFPAPGDHDARAVLGSARLGFDSRGQMHRECHGTDDTIRMVHQADKLPDVSLADKVDDVVQRRMPVVRFAALHELNSPPKVIHDLLITARVPPFCGKIKLTTRHQDPESAAIPGFLDLRHPAFFDRR